MELPKRIFIVFAALCILATSASFIKVHGEEGPSVTTLAILPFDNNSVTDSEQYTPLTNGLPAMLITDLNREQNLLKVIERDKIRSILEEIDFNRTGSVDRETMIRAGKLLGAQSIAFGSFMVMGDMVRIDARLVKTETGEVLMAESATGSAKQFLDLEKDLVRKIAQNLGVALKADQAGEEGKTGSDIQAALLYSKALDAMDKGDIEVGRNLFTQCIKADPSYRERISGIKGFQP